MTVYHPHVLPCVYFSGEKRYSYRHLHSGRVQWDYPAAGGGADAAPSIEDMDICTTPPPPPPPPPTTHAPTVTLEEQLKEHHRLMRLEEEKCAETEAAVELVAPPPPKIERVECPPPPILTEDDMVVPPLPLIPEELPPPPPPPPEEPLPPGVEGTPKNVQQTNVPPPPPENLNTVLDSFYSDIAAMESSIIINNVPEEVQKVETSSTITNAADVIPVESVKKRKKLKMSQGLSMKKKGVSKLVEKWKIVQKTLD